jgi:hypothetical protein
MTKSSTPIYFPPKLSNNPEDPLSKSLSDQEYARLQVELVKATYARAAQLGNEHLTPEVATFLEVFINLIDTMELNGPDDAHACMTELKKILNAVYPASINGETSEGSAPRRCLPKIVKH